jgi:hypothetical protein
MLYLSIEAAMAQEAYGLASALASWFLHCCCIFALDTYPIN